MFLPLLAFGAPSYAEIEDLDSDEGLNSFVIPTTVRDPLTILRDRPLALRFSDLSSKTHFVPRHEPGDLLLERLTSGSTLSFILRC